MYHDHTVFSMNFLMSSVCLEPIVVVLASFVSCFAGKMSRLETHKAAVKKCKFATYEGHRQSVVSSMGRRW